MNHSVSQNYPNMFDIIMSFVSALILILLSLKANVHRILIFQTNMSEQALLIAPSHIANMTFERQIHEFANSTVFHVSLKRISAEILQTKTTLASS